MGRIKKRIVLLGIDNAGKTSIMRYLKKRGKLPDDTPPMPTVGFSTSTIVHHVGRDVLEITCFDVGGQHKMRELWPQYCHATNGLLVVVDSNDHDRIPEVKRELTRLISIVDLSNASVLLLANKQDQPHAISPQEVAARLGLADMPLAQWHVAGTVGIDGTGIDAGFDWLASTLVVPRKGSRLSSSWLSLGCSGSPRRSSDMRDEVMSPGKTSDLSR